MDATIDFFEKVLGVYCVAETQITVEDGTGVGDIAQSFTNFTTANMVWGKTANTEQNSGGTWTADSNYSLKQLKIKSISLI